MGEDTARLRARLLFGALEARATARADEIIKIAYDTSLMWPAAG
jgi:hypothetical protein